MVLKVKVAGPAGCWAMSISMLSLKVLEAPRGPPWWS